MNPLYRTFVQIVESETLSRAADLLHLTQPTVTRQVQQLERDLGVVLFDRIGRRLVLNRAGERVYRTARQILALEQKLADELNEFADPDVGTVYIGAGITPSIYLLPPILADYRKRHPRVQFQVRTGSSRVVLEMLLRREIDLGVVTTVEPRPDIVATPLILDELLVVTKPLHPLTEQMPCRFTDIAQYPWVLMRPESGLRRIVTRMADEHNVKLPIAMETDSLESINRLVQHGVGVSVVPRSSVQDDILAGRLVEITVEDTQLGARTITLITRSDSVLPASASRFVEVLPASCRALGAVGAPQSLDPSPSVGAPQSVDPSAPVDVLQSRGHPERARTQDL
ncbi:LysR family transcriptional regulator [Alicyclobacillus cycloheptanicus]|uniref:DNA-binding transcriptional LysR family regulator n=1 Tax=Alicyclobacillus cycloheptanicus TaxID=1457 RepID=A0ABT9XG25_9BACL|nr:LysR family transcriptional regulator [Alicyclobacillus cycloheptanicus]MDQ0189152.1 DNA-binding transcriptional LysR family regulator [Alicyclobacillus cycloheptanicus]WDM00345.1 LysR family transcriptional regulator [Alicyclobacillus cycloheptanicus]